MTSVYNPSAVYVLELASMLAIRDENSALAVGRDVAEALQDVVRNAPNLHPMIVSRAVFYLLHLLEASYVCISNIPQKTNANLPGTFFHPCACHPPYYLKVR